MKISEKSTIKFRIEHSKKMAWKKHCLTERTTLTELIISSVEGVMTSAEKREVIKFIEKQDNLFSKIENNINQFAKVANTHKLVTPLLMKDFNEKLAELAVLKKNQNDIFERIFSFMADNSRL